MLNLLIMTFCLLCVSMANNHKRSTDECYRCSNFDALGRGFIEADDNPPMCGHYKECYKAKDTNEITSVERWCAPGSWTDPDEIQKGAPCTSQECNRTTCDDCDITSITVPGDYSVYPCPYVQMSPEWLFGVWQGVDLIEVGSCGENGTFNDTAGICACTEMQAACTCKVSIPLTTDTDSHGCNGGWVGQLGMPAMATVEDGCGQFNGYDPLLTNGAHLGTYVIDGLFAGEWVHELKLTVAFNVDASWDNTPEGSKWGVVTYGDCSGGSSFGFHIWKNATETYLVATLEMFSTNSLDKLTLVAPGVVTGTDYYAAFMYKEVINPSWSLYFMSSSAYDACVADLNACPAPVDTRHIQGAITPRGCGFVIGFSASDSADEFFHGQICRVSVDIEPDTLDIHPCQ